MQPDISVAPPTPAAGGMPLGIVPPTQRQRSRRMIGEIVVDLGLADRLEVEAAVAEARATASSTGTVLVSRGTLTADQLARVIAERFGVDYVDLAAYSVDFRACSLVTPEAAHRYGAVPIGYKDERTLLLVTSDPANVLAIDDVAMMTGLDVHPVVASSEDIGALIAKLARLEQVGEAPDEAEEDLLISDVRDADDDAPVIKLVHSIIAEAIELGASDVHFDPDGSEMRVHYRIDGVLKASNAVPRRMVRGVVSRVKIMANLDISERRVPQDGRLALAVDGRSVDVRVVTLPLVGGESVVMRVLDHAGGGVIQLDQLGLGEAESARLRHAIGQPYGATLVTGPTGSGKTTTLYGALAVLNTGDRSIITIEDPVEYRVDGIKQMQVNGKVGMTFARALRTMVRADPDIIMVGEIRDHETAQIAIEAALTGHLVLSTLHTRDAPTAISRLLDMNIEPFLTASAIDCVVAQRLARTLCKNCKVETVMPAETLREAGYDVTDDVTIFEPGVCGRCGGTGYRGRIGLFEVMPITENIRSLIMRQESANVIAQEAVDGGMRRLRDDGFEKVRQGLTTLAEVGRVAGS